MAGRARVQSPLTTEPGAERDPPCPLHDRRPPARVRHGGDRRRRAQARRAAPPRQEGQGAAEGAAQGARLTQRGPPGGTPCARLPRPLLAGHGRPRHVLPDDEPVPARQHRDRTQRLLLRHQALRGAGRLPPDGGAADRRGGPREALVDDRRRPAHGLDRPRRRRRPEGPPRDERKPHHHRGGLARGGLAGRDRGLARRPPRRGAGPGAPAREPGARDAPVRDRLRQQEPGRLRRLEAGRAGGELPLRVQQGAGIEREL